MTFGPVSRAQSSETNSWYLLNNRRCALSHGILLQAVFPAARCPKRVGESLTTSGLLFGHCCHNSKHARLSTTWLSTKLNTAARRSSRCRRSKRGAQSVHLESDV